MLRIICILVKKNKTGLINNYLDLLSLNIVLFSNALKAILCIILHRNQLK